VADTRAAVAAGTAERFGILTFRAPDPERWPSGLRRTLGKRV
jgi:hypothetical protein